MVNDAAACNQIATAERGVGGMVAANADADGKGFAFINDRFYVAIEVVAIQGEIMLLALFQHFATGGLRWQAQVVVQFLHPEGAGFAFIHNQGG